MKNRYYAVMGVLSLALIAACWLWLKNDKLVSDSTQTKTVKIGALLSLTGKYAESGEDVNNALALARDDIRIHEGIDFQITIEDNGGDPKTAVPAAAKLIDIEKLPLIITGPGSSANLAVAPLMKNTTFIAISATPGLVEQGSLILKFQADVGSEVKRIVAFMRDRNHQRAAVIYDSSSATLVAGREEFIKEFSAGGGTITINEGFDGRMATDFRTLILKIKDSNPDSVYVFSNEGLAGSLVKQARELAVNQPIYGWSGFETDNFLQRAGVAAEGVIITAQPFSCGGSESMGSYCADYRQRFKDHEPLQYGAHAYDLLHILAQIIKDNNLYDSLDTMETKELVVQKFNAIRHYQGVSGDVTFDGSRNMPDKDFVFRIVKDGKFIDVK